jgi:hypothetical protein
VARTSSCLVAASRRSYSADGPPKDWATRQCDWNTVVGQTTSPTTFRTWIAIVAVTDDDTTTDNSTENRSDYRACGRATAHGALVTTRRRAARIGNRDRLRTRRHWHRVVRNWSLSNRLGLILSNLRRRLGLHDLGRRFRSAG